MEMETAFYVEPVEPINTLKKMAVEIVKWADEDHHVVEIVSDVDAKEAENQSMLDKVMQVVVPRDLHLNLVVDGKKYRAKMEPAKKMMLSNGIASNKAILNYRCIYFYKNY